MSSAPLRTLRPRGASTCQSPTPAITTQAVPAGAKSAPSQSQQQQSTHDANRAPLILAADDARPFFDGTGALGPEQGRQLCRELQAGFVENSTYDALYRIWCGQCYFACCDVGVFDPDNHDETAVARKAEPLVVAKAKLPSWVASQAVVALWRKAEVEHAEYRRQRALATPAAWWSKELMKSMTATRKIKWTEYPIDHGNIARYLRAVRDQIHTEGMGAYLTASPADLVKQICAEAGPGSITLWWVETTGRGFGLRGHACDDLATFWAALFDRVQTDWQLRKEAVVPQFLLIQRDEGESLVQFLHYIRDQYADANVVRPGCLGRELLHGKLLSLLCERECAFDTARAEQVKALIDSLKQDPRMSDDEVMRVFVELETHLAHMDARAVAAAQVEKARAAKRSTIRTATAAGIGPSGSMAKRRRVDDDDDDDDDIESLPMMV
ncbi:hypothetical protein GGF32_004181 [Allomyces javanicus]|nr:hypothetical protein GGF32_004181 [Allomyces javanicus]